MGTGETILVTGGAGYIGSHTVRALLDTRWEPWVFDNFSTGHRAALPPDLPVFEGNLGDRARLRAVLEHARPWAVIHFAASIEAGESMADPSRFYWNNVVNTLNLVEEMRHAGVRRIVFSSSAGVYGAPERIPIPETTALLPVNTYGATKAMMERVLEDYRRAYGIQQVSLRYFNACGAHPRGDIGEAHPVKSHLIELAILAALGKRPGITVFGTDYPTPDGTAVRDYVHVVDLAHAHVLALDALSRDQFSGAFNVGLGSGFSVLEVLEAVERVTGRRLARSKGPRRPGDPPVLVADSSRIQHDLGWQPRYTNLDDIIETAWRWHRTHPDDFGRTGP